MRHATVRISEGTRDLLRSLAAEEGAPMQLIVERAVEGYRRRRFLEQVNTAYASLRSDDRIWAEVEEERAAWDVTLSDGLVAEGCPAAAPKRTATRKRQRRQ